MGSLLKLEGRKKVLMFYSEPVNGYYRGNNSCISKDEYDDWFKEDLTDDMVWTEGWYDVSNAFSDIANGLEVNDFIVDCIMQGKVLEYNKPYNFSLDDIKQ